MCLNGGTCVDNWTFASCNCANGYQGSRCEEQVTASFTMSVMGMKFEPGNDVFNVTFEFLAASSWDGIILTTDSQVGFSFY